MIRPTISRDEDQLEDEHVHRQHFEVVGLLLSAAVDLADDEQDDGQQPKQQRQLVHAGQECDPGKIGDIAVADGIEGLIGDDDRAGARGHQQQRAAVDQPAGQGGHKGGDAQLRHQESR